MNEQPTPQAQPEAVLSSAELGQPKPRAWVIFADNGSCRMWTTFQPHIQATADAAGLQVTHLYDQAAIDAAVAAERERIATKLHEMDCAHLCGIGDELSKIVRAA